MARAGPRQGGRRKAEGGRAGVKAARRRGGGQLAIIRFIRGKTRGSSFDEKLPKCGTASTSLPSPVSRLDSAVALTIYPTHSPSLAPPPMRPGDMFLPPTVRPPSSVFSFIHAPGSGSDDEVR